MSKTRLMQACAGVALAIGVANTADAGLTIDLRLTNGGGKTLDISSLAAGSKIPIDIYATVTGTATGVEGFQSAQGAIVGNGNVVGQILPAGDLDEATFEVTLPALDPFVGNGAQRGESKHIGVTDGIVDLGDITNRGEDLGNLVVFRANSMQVTSGAVIPDGREFKIGHIEFLLEQVPTQGQAAINFAFRRGPTGEAVQSAALFRQDGAVANGTGDVNVGAPVTLIVPEPGTFGLAALGAVGLLARRRK